MKALILSLAVLAAAPAVQAQVQPYRPINPIDMAAQARQERERLRAGFDARQAEARTQQLQTDLTIYELRSARGPVLAPPEGPTVYDGPLPDLITTAEGQRQTTDDARRRLDAMDNWSRRNDAGS